MSEPTPDPNASFPPSGGPRQGIPFRRRPWWAWVRIVRPLALLAGVATVVGFAFIVAEGEPSWHRTLRLALAMAAALAATSLFNDAHDAPHDRDTYVWRPIPAGLISVRAAERAALVCAVAALALAGSLGWRPLLLAAGGLLASGAYTVTLRHTPLSWIAYSVAFSLVPLFVAEGLDRFDEAFWWSFAVGGVGGLAFHLAIKLPDYERDDQDGVRNVLHWFTIDYAIPVTWGVFAAYLVIAAGSANVQEARAEWIVPPAAIGLVAGLTMIGVLWPRVTERRLVVQRWLFGFAIIAMALGWLGSITP